LFEAVTAPVLADELGPRGRRRVTIATALSLVVLAAVVVVVVARLSAKHQFDGDLWKPFTEYSVLKFLFLGLVNTLKVAAVAMALALMFGGTLALGRLSLLRPVRWLTTGLIELFRAYPLLLLIFFMPKLLKLAGVELSSFWPLAIALMLYNGSILAEIFRAGVLSLDHGQEEAAQSIGLGYWQSMAFVLAPQAVRRMAPAIVSQLITLLKDTALGALIFYDELLRRADGAGNEFGNNLQMYVIVAAVYIVINFALSRLARRLEVRQRRRYGADAISVAGVEELAGA
jgi:glutamate transport system permease protein